MRRVLNYVLVFALQAGLLAGVLYLFLPLATERLRPQLLSYMAANLSEEERKQIYEQIAESFGGAWDTTPDPLVGRLAKRNWIGVVNQADVQINNGGLRHTRAYGPKPRKTFRIVCLGDSFVFGGGGRQEDRFCDQLEEFYTQNRIKVDGDRIEALAVGLGSWTMVQEATYLSRRISEYDPDLILMLSVPNDITENSGVTGLGVTTRDFSIDGRQWGSGIFHNTANEPYKGPGYTALQWDLSPASRVQWDRGMAVLKRLVELQHKRRGLFLLSSLNPLNSKQGPGAAFTQILKIHVRAAGIEVPMLEVTYQKSKKEMRLPHDNHPSRAGHSLLRDQYLHGFDALGWIEVPDELLPAFPKGVKLRLSNEPDAEVLADWNRQYIQTYLRSKLDFAALSPEESNAFLGGIFPEARNRPMDHPPWASVRAGFVMRRPPEATTIELVIRIPERIELFPFRLEISVDGEPVATEDVPDTAQAGDHRLNIPLPPTSESEVVELTLRTRSYFCGIGDGRMKSYQLISAELR